MEKIDPSNFTRKYLDIPYADISSSQNLDIYLPERGEGPFPVITAVHGGAFREGSKRGRNMVPMLKGVEHGYAVASIEYRLSGEAEFPAAVNDVKAAVRFLKNNARKYNLKTDKFAAWGDSAGGNLVSMLGTTGGTNNLYDSALGYERISDKIQAVVDWFGPMDFLKMDLQFQGSEIEPTLSETSSKNSPESQYLGKLITSVPDLVKKANPAVYISENTPPFLIQHGTKDSYVPVMQSIDFANALLEVLDKSRVELQLLKGAGHGGREFESKENLKMVFEFLDKHLKN